MYYYDSSDGRMLDRWVCFVYGAKMGHLSILHCIIPANAMFFSMKVSFGATNEILSVPFVCPKTESCLDLP